MKWSQILTVFCACIALSNVSALKEKLDISKDDRRVFHIESFGYEAGGHFEMSVDDFILYVPFDYIKPDDNRYRIAFVLEKSDTDLSDNLDQTRGCFYERQSPDRQIISLSSRADWKKLRFVKRIDEPGYYHLYFSNCEPNTQVSFKLELIQYNIDRNGAENYLSAGESSLPAWFFLLSLAFIVELVIWVGFIRKQAENVKAIHHLMTAVIVLKILSLFFEAMRYQTLKTNGTQDAWIIFYYIFNCLKGMMMFMVIVLIGTGWSYLKPVLTERDKQVMLVVMVVQAMVNVAMVVVGETAPGTAGWITWKDILHVADMVCCIVILMPIVWSIKHLRQASSEDLKDGKVARSIQRLKSFRRFYLSLVSYIYFTRIIVFVLSATLPFELAYLSYVLSEVASLAFYAITGFLFRPQPRNPYLPLDSEEDAAESAAMLEMARAESEV